MLRTLFGTGCESQQLVIRYAEGEYIGDLRLSVGDGSGLVENNAGDVAG